MKKILLIMLILVGAQGFTQVSEAYMENMGGVNRLCLIDDMGVKHYIQEKAGFMIKNGYGSKKDRSRTVISYWEKHSKMPAETLSEALRRYIRMCTNQNTQFDIYNFGRSLKRITWSTRRIAIAWSSFTL